MYPSLSIRYNTFSALQGEAAYFDDLVHQEEAARREEIVRCRESVPCEEWSRRKTNILRGLAIFSLLLVVTANGLSQTATETAQKFLAQQYGSKSVSPEALALVPRYISDYGAVTPVSVLQSRDLGFVVVVGDDGDNFVAGYVPNGDYNSKTVPEALTALLKSYEESALPPAEIANLSKGTTAVLPLLDREGVSLGQFNHPEVGGCPSGCVATAFTQIMAYHRYPDVGVGSNCYTHPVYGELCADIASNYIDWDNMDSDDFMRLSLQVGIAMDMSYCGYTGNMTGSSPTDPNYKYALQNHYKYNVHFGSTENYYMLNELQQERPIYVEITGKNLAHAVVVDGNDADGRFHINFGWGGTYNGYFALNNNGLMEAGARVYGSNIRSAVYLSPTPFSVSQQDSLALLAVNNSFGGELFNNLSLPVSQWPGVLVMNGRVIGLSVSNYGDPYEGSIPPEIGNLTGLMFLTIGGKLHGELPESLYQLTNLKKLLLYTEYGSTLEAELSPQIGNLTNLENLGISRMLVGQIPEEIANLTALKTLHLYSNELTGAIPASIGSLVNMHSMWLFENQLTGPVPDGIGNMSDLTYLSLYSNGLTGSIPATIGNANKLIDLNLSNNKLSGEIPASIGNLVELDMLDLSNNLLEGEVPEEIGNLTGVTVFRVNNNRLTALPNEIGRLQKITSLNIGNNLLAALPDSLVRLSGITEFLAPHNKIALLPPNFGAWRDLHTIDLSDNLITEFPEELCYLLNLASLNLSNNRIESLPVSIGEFKVPVTVELDSNEIRGNIPASFLREADNFSVAYNRLTFENIPEGEGFKNPFFDQKNVEVTDTLFKAPEGDTITIDIRELTGLNDPNNEYYWFKYPQRVTDQYKDPDTYLNEGPVLSVVMTGSKPQKYYCKIFNQNAPTYSFMYSGDMLESPVLRFLNTEAVTLMAMTEEEQLESIYPESYIISSDQVTGGEVSDRLVTLVSPFNTRGTIKWQSSADGNTWTDAGLGTELVLEPKTVSLYRCVLSEADCDPLYSEPIRVVPLGQTLFDDIVNVDQEPFTVRTDSIEVTLPAGLTSGDFRLTITKLDNPPAAPEGYRMGSVYDVTVSFASVFELPLEIRLKNYDATGVETMKIPDIRPVYFDEINRKWVAYNEGGLALTDSSVYFRTHHLTKLGWWELEHGSYTHSFANDKVEVVYKYEDGSTEDANYYSYWMSNIRNAEAKPWHTENTDPNSGGTPYLVQDIAAYLKQIIDAFDGGGLLNNLPGKFTVYLSNTGDGLIKEFLGYGDAHGYIDGSGYSGGYFYINSALAYSTDEVRRTLAHEYMHFIQSKYFDVQTGNYFFAEAHAPLADRLVWTKEELEGTEPELNLGQSLNPEKGVSSIYDLLGKSWDSGTLALFSIAEKKLINSADANLSSTFLHYMRTWREGDKLDIVKLLKDHRSFAATTNWSWRGYINNRLQTYLSTTIGDEYDAFVRYLLEGGNKEFTITNTGGGNPFSPLIKNSGPGNDGTFARRATWTFEPGDDEPKIDKMAFAVPYLGSKVVVMGNQTADRAVVVNYKRKHALNDDEEVYYGRWDFKEEKVVFVEISDSTSYSLLLDARTEEAGKDFQNMAFLLFVNKRCPDIISVGNDFNADFELTATPVINIDDLVYANVTDRAIHNYDDGGKGSFIINGRMDIWKSISMPLQWELKEYSRTKRMANDSTIVVEANFTEYMSINNGPSLPATINEWDKKQLISYNFITGKLDIIQVTRTESTWGGYYDEGDIFHAAHKYKITQESQRLKLKDIFLFVESDMGEMIGNVNEFTTVSTAHTQSVLEGISHSVTETQLDINGNVTGTSTRNYTGTDFLGDDLTITMWFNYE